MSTPKDVKKIVPKADIGEIIKGTNELIDEHNLISRNLSFKSNFSGQIIENIAFAAGETKTIPHSLGIKPKHRIVLNLEGNGVISDIPSGWNNFSIQLKNNGAVAITVTVMLVRE